MTARKNRLGSDEKLYKGAMRWMGIGIEFALVIGICAYLGYRLDEIEGTSPGWMILGFFVGFGIMFYSMYQRAKRDEKEEEEEKEKHRRQEEDNPPEQQI
jgi:F0F1-type ATP synthase assembly protein I